MMMNGFSSRIAMGDGNYHLRFEIIFNTISHFFTGLLFFVPKKIYIFQPIYSFFHIFVLKGCAKERKNLLKKRETRLCQAIHIERDKIS